MRPSAKAMRIRIAFKALERADDAESIVASYAEVADAVRACPATDARAEVDVADLRARASEIVADIAGLEAAGGEATLCAAMRSVADAFEDLARRSTS